MQIRDSDWVDLGERAPSEDWLEEVEKTLPSRLTNFQRGRGFAPQSTEDDPTVRMTLEYVPEEAEDREDAPEELKPPFD